MAILNNLLVNGASRFLGHVYIQDLDVAGITNFGTLAATDITASGTLEVTGATTLSSTLSVSGTATFAKTTGLSGTANNSPALIVGGTASQAHIEIDANDIQGKGSGTTTADLYINNDGGKVNLGKSGLVNVEYNSTTNTSTLTTPVLSATNGSIANAVISNARVTDELIVDGVLETNEMRTNIIKAVGGQLYVAPTFVATNSTTIVCTAVTASTVSFTITDSTAINSLTYGGANWNSGSKIQFTAKITGNKTNDEPIITFSSAEGTLTSNMNANTHNFSFTVNYDGASTYFKVAATSNLTYSDMSVMMYQIKSGNDYFPVGIYIKSYGNDNKNSYIDVYGGTTAFPNARLGLLNGLKDPDDPTADLTINGTTVSGWGLMSSYAYLKGRIVSKSGTIGGWDIGANTLTSGTLGVDNSMWLTTANVPTATQFAGASSALSNWRFGIGSKFGVLSDGTMYCSNAIVSGNITATSGTIGGCNITDGTLEISAANIIDTLSASQIDTTSIIIGQNQVNGLTTDLGNAATTATNYISTITGGGIQIHDQSNTSDYIKMISSGISIYKGGNQMANFGDTITINHGTSGNAALTIDSTNGMKMYKLDGTSMAAQLNASGLIVKSGLIGGVSIVDGVMKFPERRNYMLNTWNPSTVAADRPMIKGQATNTQFSTGTYTTASHGVRVTNTGTGRTSIQFGSSTASSGSMNGLVAGKTYTISFDAAFKQLSSSTGMNNGTTYYTRFYLYDDRATTGTFANTAYITLFTYTKALKGTEQSGHYAFTFTIPDNVTMVYLVCRSNMSTASHYAAGDYIELNNIMLEEGNIETPWQPAPEDVIVDNIYTANTTTIDGGKITTRSIAADKITVTDLSAFGATIGGFDITSTAIKTADVAVTSNADNSISLSSADFTRTINSISRSGLRFAIGDKFGVTGDGIIYASGAKITGELNADTGTFGGSSGFTISTNKLYSNGKSAANSANEGIYIQSGSGGGIYLGVYDSTSQTCPFQVTADGILNARNANISGDITATSGKIGSWTINGTNLEQREMMSGTQSYYYSSGFGNRTLAGINDSIRLWAGWIENDPSLLPEGETEEISTDEPDKPFYVTSRGVVHAASGSVFGDLSKAYVSIDDTSFDMFYGNSNILHFGYGNGINSSGTTSTAPYYTIGTRQEPASLEESIAVGNYSLGAGINVIASGYCSIALGSWVTASGFISTAMGSGTTASGAYSTAMGLNTTASASDSMAIGFGTTASGNHSTAIGSYTIASNEASTAIGSYTIASGYVSTAMGANTKSLGYYSTTMGRNTVATASSSTAIGKYNVATRSGSGTEADPYTYTDAGNYAFIIGNGTGDATADRSNALTVDWDGLLWTSGGISTNGSIKQSASSVSSGTNATALGIGTVATNNYQLVIGKYNAATRSGSGTSSSPYTYSSVPDYPFIIGKGTGTATADRSNALTVDWSGNLVASGSVSDADGSLGVKAAEFGFNITINSSKNGTGSFQISNEIKNGYLATIVTQIWPMSTWEGADAGVTQIAFDPSNQNQINVLIASSTLQTYAVVARVLYRG